MRRREFIAAVSAAAAYPLAARAQQSAMPIIGFINPASARSFAEPLSAFLKGLGQIGYVEGHNVAIEYRWAEDRNDRLPAMAADLVRRQVDVIVATSTGAALAAVPVTSTIPIVFEMAADPVQLGLVASLDRPGANVTGVTQMNDEVAPKRVELLHELVPTASVIALLVNPSDPILAESESKAVKAAAQALGLALHILSASSERDFDAVFAKLSQLRAGGLVISTGGLFTGRSEQLAALATRYAMPTVYKGREFTAAGGLLSYGSDILETYRLAGMYTGRVLKGEKPADLPIQQSTKIELFINLKTAKTLGITVPIPILGRADEVIE